MDNGMCVVEMTNEKASDEIKSLMNEVCCMAITYAPKVGEILECNFGQFEFSQGTTEIDYKNYNGRIPPEMIKRRMVIILNGKLDAGCLVVPVSSSKNIGYIQRGLHIPLDTSLFKVTDFYDERERWAKCDLVQLVSKKRLFKFIDNGQRFDQFVTRDSVTSIQKGVIKAINATSLVTPG